MAYLPNKNRISTLNSTATLLNAGITFTGTGEDVTQYDSVIVSVKTDQNGSYTVQFSNDNTNWDSTLTRYYRTTQIGPPHRFTITRKYCRVTFTNSSASNQTYLRLQTTFGEKADLNIPLDSVMSQDYDSLSVRPTNYNYETALGRRQGSTTWNKFGYNGDLDVGTEVVAAQGGTFTFLTSASTLTIVSSDVNDDGSPAGTGAQTVTVIGVDANRASQTVTYTMNGTTNVVSAETWLGINRAYVSAAGSTYSNVGNITITATTGGTVQGYIPATKSTTQQCMFFTQDNHNLLADWLVVNAEKLSGGGTPIVQFRGWIWNATTNAKTEIFYLVVNTSVETVHELNPSQPFVIGEKSVFWIEATSDTANSVVTARFSGIEVRDIDA